MRGADISVSLVCFCHQSWSGVGLGSWLVGLGVEGSVLCCFLRCFFGSLGLLGWLTPLLGCDSSSFFRYVFILFLLGLIWGYFLLLSRCYVLIVGVRGWIFCFIFVNSWGYFWWCPGVIFLIVGVGVNFVVWPLC